MASNHKHQTITTTSVLQAYALANYQSVVTAMQEKDHAEEQSKYIAKQEADLELRRLIAIVYNIVRDDETMLKKFDEHSLIGLGRPLFSTGLKALDLLQAHWWSRGKTA